MKHNWWWITLKVFTPQQSRILCVHWLLLHTEDPTQQTTHTCLWLSVWWRMTDSIFSKRSLAEVDNWTKPADHKTTNCTVIEMQGVQYCNETTLHGFQYLTHPGIFTKLVWLVVVGACQAGSIYFFFQNLNVYLQVGQILHLWKDSNCALL